jgi:hypothetical protein
MGSSGRDTAGKGAFLWLVLVITALLVGAFMLATRDTRRGAGEPEYSIARTDDRGAAVLYRLYQRRGLPVKPWDRDFVHLSGKGLLILLAPARESGMFGSIGDILPNELAPLDDWVKAGNVVVVMSRHPNPLYYALGLIQDEPKGLSGTNAEPVQPSVLAEGVKGLHTMTQFGFKYGRAKPNNPLAGGNLVIEEPPIPQVPADQWLELFVKKDQSRSVPQVVTAARGKGMYVAVNDVYPASNLGITTADNARFLLNLARLAPAGGTIWFDERHKRAVDRGFISYLRDRAMAPLLIYAVILLGLYFWRAGSRLGPPEPLADPRRDTGEYLAAVAELYRNAGMAKEALGIINEDFRRRLVGALRMDGLTDLDEVGRRFEQRTGRPGLEARQVLIETEALLARKSLTETEAVQAAARLARLDASLHGPKQTPRWKRSRPTV